MPYMMKKVGSEFCVFNKTTNANKGCSKTRADAIKHMRALYAAEGKTFSELDTLVELKSFTDLNEVVADTPVWIQVFPYGHWPHPQYTDTTINRERAERMVKNFKENVRRIDIMTDYEHGLDKSKGNKASGVIKDLEVRDDGIWGAVAFTKTAAQEIKDGEWKYFSGTMLDVWQDDETDETFEDVLIGGGLTNRPWMKDRVPLNFSEVAVADSKEGLRFKVDGDDVLVSVDGNDEWRKATVDEVKEWEHSEPGTGSPPQPRTNEDGSDESDIKSGSRRPTPPPEPNNSKEGSVVNREQLVAFAKAIGIEVDESWDDPTLSGKIEEQGKKLFSENTTLADFKKKHDEEQRQNDQAKAFAEQYPEEYKRMKKLENRENTLVAKEFSERFDRITVKDGETKKKTTKGYSGLAMTKIEEMAKAFSEGNADLKLFGEVLEVLTDDHAVVDYGETGSQREVNDLSTSDDVAKAFAEAATAIQNEAGGPDKMSWGDAVAKAATQHPQLAKAYSELRTRGA